jgi:hypothetical protein
MNRRMFLLGATVALCGAPALAQIDRTTAILRALEAEGYTRIETRRTWLGRVQIEARGEPGRREIVLNPHTGEILRDLFEPDDDDDDDDDEDEDREDERDD